MTDWYKSYSNKVTLNGATIRTQRINEKNEFFEETYQDALEYNLVGLGDTLTLFNSWIYAEQSYKKVIPEKQIILAPNQDDAMFFTGQYVYVRNDENSPYEAWLLTSSDIRPPNKPRGMIKKCNTDLSWYDVNGLYHSYKAVIDDSLTQTDFDYNKFLIIQQGMVRVDVQQNEITDTITANDEFVFSGQRFKVTNKNNFTLNKTMTLYLVRIADTDIVNPYSYALNINSTPFNGSVSGSGILTHTLTLNGENTLNPVKWSSSNPTVATINQSTGLYNLLAVGSVTFKCEMTENATVFDTVVVTVSLAPTTVTEVRISPEITEVFKGSIQTYTIYKYINNVAQADTFAITANGIPATYYKIIVLTGNSFTVESLDSYNGLLTVNCVSNVDAASDSIDIKMRGAW